MAPELPDGRVALHVDGRPVGGLCEDWLARALEAPTPFVLRDGVLELVPAIASFAGRSAALRDEPDQRAWLARAEALSRGAAPPPPRRGRR
jgi:hypothetical protein